MYMGVHQYNYTYIYIYYVYIYIYITSVIIIVYVHDMWVLHMGFKLSSVLFVDLWLRLWEKNNKPLTKRADHESIRDPSVTEMVLKNLVDLI